MKRINNQEELMMNDFLTRALMLGVFLLVAAVSHAETVNTNADFANNKKTLSYIFSRPMQEPLFQLAVGQDRKFKLKSDCKSDYNIKPDNVMVWQPIDFPDGKQNPVKGVWEVRYQAQRCGDSKFYNAVFIASGDGNTVPEVHAYYPGATSASPLLIKDALQSVVPAALAVNPNAKDCKDVDMFDMNVTQEAHNVTEKGKALKGVWNETWTLYVCGSLVDVPITFIPDATGGGTTFAVNNGAVKSRTTISGKTEK
jgi:hypothetical protein